MSGAEAVFEELIVKNFKKFIKDMKSYTNS